MKRCARCSSLGNPYTCHEYRHALKLCNSFLLQRGARMSCTVGQRELTTVSKLSMSFFVLRFSQGVFGSMRRVKSIHRRVAHSSGVVGKLILPSISPYILPRCGTGV